MDDERKPVSTLSDLSTLDEIDMLSGYMAGFYGDRSELGQEFNRSYWHGWCNGMRDRNKMKPTAESVKLAHEYIESMKRKAKR